MRHVPDSALHPLRIGSHINPADHRCSRRRAKKPAEHPNGRRLPRAVAAKKAEDFTGADLEGDIVYSDELTEAPCQLADVSHGRYLGERLEGGRGADQERTTSEDVDLQDEEASDENMNFGFIPGDEGIPEPYFYATASPPPAGITEAPLPAGAHWHTEGWTGAVLPYAALRGQDQPIERMLEISARP